MAAKKKGFSIKKAKNGFTSIKLPVSVRYTMKRGFIPFGMNDNYTMKLEFSADELPLYDTILKKEGEIVKNIMTEMGQTYSIRTKLRRNGMYMPTIMCAVKNRKHTIKSELYQKHKGDIHTFYDLEKTYVKVIIECKRAWVIGNHISCSWEIQSLSIL